MYSAQGTPRASGMPSPMLEPSTPGLTHSPSSSGNSTSSRSSSVRKRFSLRHRQHSKTTDANGDEKDTVSSSSGAETNGHIKSTSEPTHQQTQRTSSKPGKSLDLSRLKRKQRNQHNRWWRISDDKIKESKTSDVLGMQREVYLLFYEIVTPEVWVSWVSVLSIFTYRGACFSYFALGTCSHMYIGCFFSVHIPICLLYTWTTYLVWDQNRTILNNFKKSPSRAKARLANRLVAMHSVLLVRWELA